MIGIGISTTPNRNVLDLDRFNMFMPAPSHLSVVMDENYEGVAKTKNKLLAELDYCDHIFLFDDDTYPIADNWWVPYTESKEPHLMYQFKLPGKPESDMKPIESYGNIIGYSHTRGAMLYIKREVLDIVGGFDEAYKFGYEHTDWTNRIHNAGLTTFRAMDVVGSDKLIYCMDQDGKVQSSMNLPLRRFNMQVNRSRYQKSKTSKEYKRYK